MYFIYIYRFVNLPIYTTTLSYGHTYFYLLATFLPVARKSVSQIQFTIHMYFYTLIYLLVHSICLFYVSSLGTCLLIYLHSCGHVCLAVHLPTFLMLYFHLSICPSIYSFTYWPAYLYIYLTAFCMF